MVNQGQIMSTHRTLSAETNTCTCGDCEYCGTSEQEPFEKRVHDGGSLL